ncbi:hypothetical protein [Spiroplasma citri]|uniref:Uncharacterized protein n=1 Tax=Spiroplasma citri TaxID=2133 RepID=Q14PA8_SPICI|nr:hypothetical protein [Spiroplasma citri]APE74345.1 hypothetical protein SCITRI_00440 [Spiroplasma citri]QIA66564.1 hypothetical protein GMI18_02075 [Spiroplasma citri]QIA68444.1 hypothetical protein GL298_02195 [Spiroplasma citri]QIA70320.1 hypothetical protein GL981_02200 [Spiroplasma citri]QIA72555.1 hypothetical protein GL982_02215 [Spiroplasma citri]
MNKRYLLIMKSDFSNDILTKSFYTLEEAKITANVEMKHGWLTTIIDLEDKNIKWQGE